MASTPELTSGAAVPATRRNPLPEGTLSVGVGLLLGGLAQYGFLAISAHALGPVRNNPLSTFWAAMFVLAPGFYLPLEQEVGRALAARRVRGEGGRPLVLRALLVGGAALVVLVALTIAFAGALTVHVFSGDSLFVGALVVGLVAYLGQFLLRGSLLGSESFGWYGFVLGAEGVLRVLLAVVLGAGAVRVAGVYGFALVVATLLASVVAFAARRGLLRPGPPASFGELSSALGWLLVSSVCTQFLLSVGTLAVQVLATASQKTAASQFLSSRIIAFSPVFLLQAVQPALLNKLSALRTAGRATEFRRALAQVLGVVLVFGAIAVVGLAVLGPFATRLLFGPGFELTNLDFALLGAACALFMVAQMLSYTLISLRGYPRATAGWVGGAACFVAVTALGRSLFLRVETGLLAGAAVTVVVMGVLLLPLMRALAPPANDQEALPARRLRLRR